MNYFLKILGALGTEHTRLSSVAQCVASVAAVELPTNEWKQCIPTLVRNVVGKNVTERLRESSLEAIGKYSSLNMFLVPLLTDKAISIFFIFLNRLHL